MTLLLAVLGLAGLLAGSELALRGATGVARRLGVSAWVVGLTLTSVGTSLPEIATNVAAALSSRGGVDASGVAVGNVVGSNLSQITLLMGLVALFTPLAVPKDALRRDGPMLLVALGLFWAAALDGSVTPLEGLALVAVYVGYLAWVARSSGGEETAREASGSLAKPVLWTLVGLAIVVGAANLLVTQVLVFTEALGVSAMVGGLLVGLGTGLPELVVSLRAVKRSSGLSLGNLIGSNITDPLLSLGAGAAIYPVAVDRTTLWLDLPWWAACTVVALFMMREHRDVSRSEAGSLLVLFALYLWVRFVFFAA